MTRSGLQRKVSALPTGGFEFLQACTQGKPLSDAAAAAADAGADLQAMFSALVAAGAFVSNAQGEPSEPL